MKWTLTVAVEDHSTPLSLAIIRRGGRKERARSPAGRRATFPERCHVPGAFGRRSHSVDAANRHLQDTHTSGPRTCGGRGTTSIRWSPSIPG